MKFGQMGYNQTRFEKKVDTTITITAAAPLQSLKNKKRYLHLLPGLKTTLMVLHGFRRIQTID
jgi:hypothetical protein